MSDLKSKLLAEFLANEDYAYGYYNDFLNVYIATQIKVLREQRGYKTQTAFAEDKHIHQEQISLYENIDNNSWTINTLRKFARALGVTVKVSFESFSNSVDTIINFRRETLQRPSRVEDLERIAQPQAGEMPFSSANALLEKTGEETLDQRRAIDSVDPTPSARSAVFGLTTMESDVPLASPTQRKFMPKSTAQNYHSGSEAMI